MKSIWSREVQDCRKRAFTLVEMLVVIVVILILSGILLKTAALFGEKGKRAKAVAELEQIQNALNEYFVEYGSYPPVNAMAFEYESRTNQAAIFRTWLQNHNEPDVPSDFFPDVRRTEGWPSSTGRDGDLGYRYGLVSYLYRRQRGDQAHWYDSDTGRDEAAKDRWAHFLRDVPLSGGSAVHTSAPSWNLGFNTIYTNSVATISDPWGREYHYLSTPPYLRYRLWSAGPDGVSGTSDDVTYQSWSE